MINRVMVALFLLLSVGCGDEAGEFLPPDVSLIPEGFPGHVSFTLAGTEIDGAPARLKGMNVVDPIAQATWGMPQEVGEWSRDYYEQVRAWGGQIVRIPIHPEFWREDPGQATQIVRQAVDWSREVGLYVILDFHAIGMLHLDRFEADTTTTNTAEFIEFWRVTSAEFARDEHIAAYGLFNEAVNLDAPEPGSRDDWIAWKADAESAIDVIRANDPDTAVLVGGLHWTYDLTHAAALPIDRENVVYDAHIYPFTPDFKSWEEAVGEPSKTLPVFVGEWGWDVTGLYDEKAFGEPGEYGPAIAEFLDAHNFSWTSWVFSANWDPRMLADWDYNMTDYGRFVREQLWLP